MTATSSKRLRRLWLNVHLWIGMGLLGVLIPLSLSGAILVWREPLDRALHPQRRAVSGPETSQPLSAYARAADAAFAGRATLSQIRLPQAAGDPVVATGRMRGAPGPGGRPRTLTAWIDPPTARVLDAADTGRSALQVVHRLHGSLLVPQVGRKVVGWLGVAMFASCATGLWLWWPRWGGVLQAIRWRRSVSTLFNLHQFVGFWVCVPLAVLSLTGVYISFPQTARALFGRAAPPARLGPPAAPIARPALTVEAAAALALASRPGGRIVSLSTPTEGKAPAWRVEFAAPGDAPTPAVQVVDATGLVKAARADRSGPPDALSGWMRKVHDGTDMGLTWRAVIFLGGVAPTILGLSGVTMWLRSRARHRAAIRRVAEAI